LATTERVFPADHPAAPGHFPGNPIIPGAVLLDETLRAIESGLGVSLSSCRIQSAKFLAPVRPGDRVVIEFSRPDDGAIRFTCLRGGQPVLKGEVACDAASTGT
jgi:3-hydroxymyristoyl/3-hydroxydecanoyl-(acyl carrier protein) dehydratase